MIEVVPFQIEHFDAMDRDPDHQDLTKSREHFAKYPLLGPAWTLMIEHKPVVSSGVVIVWEGMGEAWMLLNGKMIERYPLTVFRVIKSGLSAIIEDCRLHRIQTFVLDGHPKAHKWIQVLGFKQEAKLDGFGPDKKAYWIYGRTTRWLNM
jgi:hypothetical protein